MFWTSFSFLTQDANFKQNESCAVCFDANFGQQDSCAQSLGQVLACYQKTPSSSKSTVAQSVLTPISSIRTVAHGLLGNFKLFNKSRKFKQNDSCAQCFDATFGQQDSCGRCFGQVLACYQKTPSSSKSKVPHSVLTPLSGNRIVAHGLLDKF